MSVQVGQISTQLTADVSNFTSGMKQAQASFLQTTAALKTGSASIGSSLNTVTSGVKTMQMTLMRGMGIIGAGFILPKLFMKAKSAIIDFNQTVDQSTIALTHFVGSAEGAERLLGTLQQFAARTPFNFQDLLGTTQQMMAMGVEAKDLLPRLTAIGDAAAGMGGSPEILQRITRALGQIQAKGRVQAEELMQLAEVGIPAYQYIATLTGGDIPAALDKMKRGQIDAGSAITAILDGLSGDFKGMMESQSKTMMGAMSTVEDFVQMTVAAIGRPVFEALRGTMLEVANFLGSDDMVKGAEAVAKNISNAMSKAGEVVGKILQTIGPVIKGILGNIYDMAAAIGQGLAAAQPFLFALAGAFMVVVGSVTVLSKAISPFLGLLKTNKTLATALVAVLIILALKKKLVGTNSEGAAKAGTAFAQSLKANISGAKEYIQTMQRFSAAQGKTLSTMGALRVGVVAGFKAMGAAVKSFLTSMLPMLAMVIAIELVVKAFEAFGAKQRVTDERTKELTSSINDQTIALLENAEALQEGAKGTDILYEALFKTGAESEKLIAAFGVLGMRSNTADISAAAGNFEDFAKKTLMAKGVTEEMATALANVINISDNNTFSGVTVSSVDANGKVTSSYVALTDAQIKMAESLEFMQDTIENTDFSKIVESQANNLIGLGKLTTAQLANARAVTDSQFVGKSFTQDQYDMALSQNIVAEATDVAREALLAEARVLENKKTDWMRYRSAVGEANIEIGKGVHLINAMREADKKGIVDTDEFISSLMGEVQAFHEMEKATDAATKGMSEYIDTLIKGEDSSKKLMNVGYEVNDSLLRLMKTADDLGVGQEEVTRTSQQMVQEFVDAALESGYLETEIQNVISALRIAQNLDPSITIYMNLDQAKADLALFMKALEAVYAIAGAGGSVPSLAPLLADIKAANDAIAMLGKDRKLPSGSGSGSGSKKDPFDWVKKWVDDLVGYTNKQISSSALGDLLGLSPKKTTGDEIREIFKALNDEAKELGIKKIPKIKKALNELKLKYQELAKLADGRDLLNIDKEKTEKKILDLNALILDLAETLKSLQTEASNISQTYGIDIVGAVMPTPTALESARDALTKYESLIEQRNEIIQSAQQYAMQVATSMMPALNESNTVGRASRILRKAQEFNQAIKEMKNRGFPKDIISEVINAGINSGGKLARGLLSMSTGDLSKLMDIRRQISDVANDTAIVSTEIMFDQAQLDTLNNSIAEQSKVVSELWSGVISTAQTALSGAQAELNTQNGILADLVIKIKAADDAMKLLIDAINKTFHDSLFKFLSKFDGVVGRLVNANPSLSVPAFAEGGIVNKAQLGIVGEAGAEAIIPLSKMGAMGTTNVYVTVTGSVVSERNLVEAVRIGLIRAQKSGKSVVL